MMQPAFSIVIPTCKRPGLLHRALRSVVNQTFNDFECIVVDDADDPETAEVVKQFADKRLALIRHACNRGAAAAYNSGIKASRGKLISILDDDDEYYPNFLEKMHLFFQAESSRISFVWTGIRNIRDTPEGEIFLSERVWPAQFSNREDAYIAATTIGNGFGLTMKRECLNAVGLYNEDFRVCIDTEHLFRLARAFDFAHIPEVLVKIHCHEDGQLTHENKLKLRLKLHEQILADNADFLASFPELRYVHFQRLAQICFSLKLKRKGQKILLSLWEKMPWRFTIPMSIISYTCCGLDFQTFVHKSPLKKLVRWVLQFLSLRQ